MGRLLGPLGSDEDLDRPDLNKCPDCGCFFAQSSCPLCGKVCPEEMRAGNRRPVKPKKKKRGGSDRVVFVDWYHSWWFIIIMMFIFPLVGIILLATSPHKKSLKIGFIVGAIIYAMISTIGIGNLIHSIAGLWNKPVDTSLDREEYIAECAEITPESFYRSASAYEGEFVCLTVVIEDKITDIDAQYNGDDYTTYYICRSTDGAEFTLLIRDCIQDTSQSFIKGDTVTVYGEGAGEVTVYDASYTPHTSPCLNVAYAVLGE